MKRKLLKIALWLLAVIVTGIAVVFIAFQVSPRPGAYLIGRMFNGPVKITDPQTYNIAEKQVTLTSDLTYTSKHQKNTYDLYLPKNTDKPLPVLIWAHGGGFVGGDKSGMKEFATRIAADAQIALQYATVQTNPNYAKDLTMTPTVPNAIKGVISYCGPVDLKQTAQQKSSSRAMRFFVKTVAWSLLGEKNWQTNPKLEQASLVSHVTKDFPPTYITDGNAYSFQEQGMALENRLKALSVPITGLFYPNDKKEITHEYQFNNNTPEAKTCYDQTLSFVKQYL